MRSLLHLLGCVWVATLCIPAVQAASSSTPTRCPGTTTKSKVTTSALYGCAGEAQDPTGRLPDWSYAGYAGGERPIPTVPVVSDVVKDHGANGKNRSDDTAAFISGLKAVAGKGALYVPPGIYRLSAPLYLASSTVLRGAGVGRTVLFFNVSLSDVFNNSYKGTTDGSGQSDFSWLGGFVATNPPPDARWARTDPYSVPVVSSALRGANQVVVSPRPNTTSLPSFLKAGQWVAIRQGLKTGSPGLANHLMGGLLPPGSRMLSETRGKQLLPLRVEKVSSKTGVITFSRKLPYEVRPEWGAVILEWRAPASEVGVEGLSIVFTDSKYAGHGKEKGYNGVFLHQAINSWVKDVHVHNADIGVLLHSTFHTTVIGAQVTSMPGGRSPVGCRNCDGHIGLGSFAGGHNLFTRFNISALYQHDLAVDWEMLSVFSNGSGRDLRPDLHRYCSYGVLWTDLHLGRGNRMFEAGGEIQSGPHTCAFNTFWNVRADKDIKLRHDNPTNFNDYGPLVNLVGVRLEKTPSAEARAQTQILQWRFEPPLGVAPAQVVPIDLYAAQRLRRKMPAYR